MNLTVVMYTDTMLKSGNKFVNSNTEKLQSRGHMSKFRWATQTHRITECSGLEGTSVGHLVQSSCRSRVTYSRL